MSMNLNPSLSTTLSASSLRGQDASNAAHGPAAVAKLRKAAAEFEAQLLSSWWTTMKQSGMSGEDEDSDPGKDTLDQLGMQAMSSAVANGRGGLGIGDMLVRSLLANHPEIAGGIAAAAKSVRGTARLANGGHRVDGN
jgi:Rod binding domain-containing protein